MPDNFDRDTGEIIERPQLPAMSENRPQNLIFASNECGEIFGALCEMQSEMIAPKRTKTAKVKGRTRNGTEYDYSYAYAPLEEVITAIKEPMSKTKLAYRQFLAVRDRSHVMRTIIVHPSGQWLGCDYPIFWDESRGMQGFASGVTYARRYGLMLALGIAAEDDDDANVADGNQAAVSDTKRSRTPAKNVSAAPPAPAFGDKTSEQVRADYTAAKTAIANAGSGNDLDAIMASSDWDSLQKDVKRLEGDVVGTNIIAKLVTLAENRRLELMPASGYEV